MATINNQNSLYWVFTAYGMQRLATFNTEDHLYLYKAKIGNYDWYTDEMHYLGEAGYSETLFRRYFEEGTGTNLGSEIPNSTTFISNKSLDSTNKIVTLSVTIPEDFSACDIRELGLYETIGGVDYLFAIVTFQPIPKPTIDTNHRIAVQFNINLKSETLSNYYNNITLDPNNNYATVDEIEQVNENLLFVETNLAEQISNNTNHIGLNRPQQLYERMEEDKEKYASFSASTTFTNLLNATSLDKVKSFWVFQHTNDLTQTVSIADLSINGLNLETDQLVTLYDRDYQGLCSYLDFPAPHYYRLNRVYDFDLLDIDQIIDNGVGQDPTIIYKDSPFTFFFVGAQNTNDHACTFIAKDNEFPKTIPAFRIQVTQDRELLLRMYTDKDNYTEYVTGANTVPKAGEFYVATISYDGNIDYPHFSATINAGVVSGSVNRVGTYTGMTKVDLHMTPYITTSHDHTDYVDSKICIMSLVKDQLSDEYIRATSYGLMALIGKNPCLIQ